MAWHLEEALKGARESSGSALRALLENDPPFSRIPYAWPHYMHFSQLHLVAPKSLAMRCTCSSEPTTWKQPAVGSIIVPGTAPSESHQLWVYQCSDCESRSSVFWMAFRSTKDIRLGTPVVRGGKAVEDASGDATQAGSIEKVAQWPRWTVRVPKRAEKAFGDKAELLKRGIHCLQEGYGIGAAAYLRRLVEDEARAIVELVRDAAVLDGDADAARNAEEALKEKLAARRLEIASKRIPPSLRVDGQNPLEVLYASLSGPLHTETEEEAVTVATMLIGSLLFVFEGLKQRVEDKQSFVDTMRAASQRRSKSKPD